MPFLVNLNRRDAASTLAVSLHSTCIAGLSSGQQIQERTFNSEPHSQVWAWLTRGAIHTRGHFTDPHSGLLAHRTQHEAPGPARSPAPAHASASVSRTHVPGENAARGARGGGAGGPPGSRPGPRGRAHTTHTTHETCDKRVRPPPRASSRRARLLTVATASRRFIES